MNIELLFPDGTVVSGNSWSEVEAALRAAQPQSYETQRAFRAAMRKRARTWSGRVIKPYAPWGSRAFVQALADAELFIISVTEGDEGDG